MDVPYGSVLIFQYASHRSPIHSSWNEFGWGGSPRKNDTAQPMVYEIRFTNPDGDIETFDVDVIANEPFEELQHRADREFADFCRSMHINPSCEKDRKLIRG